MSRPAALPVFNPVQLLLLLQRAFLHEGISA